jgi:hypothetical protein
MAKQLKERDTRSDDADGRVSNERQRTAGYVATRVLPR